MKAIFNLLKKTFQSWSAHKAQQLGAAVAYYTIFSLSPLLIIVIAMAGLAFGQQAARDQIIRQVQGLVGAQSAQLIETMLANAYHPGTNIILTIVGFATLLLGAIGLFGQLQDSLNTIWNVPPKAHSGLRGMIRDRLLSFALLLSTGFLLLVSLVISAALQGVATFFNNALPLPVSMLEILNTVFSFVVITLLFAMIFKFLPDISIPWSDVWIGSAVTALLFTLGKFLIGLYLGRSTVSLTYGAAGGLVILLLWIYYSAQILFLGAEFTKVYSDEYGSRVHLAAQAPTVKNLPKAESKRLPTQFTAALPNPGTASTPAVPEPQPQSRALVQRQLNQLAFQRNLFALLGLIAGAILEARVISHNGHENGSGRHQ